MDKKFEVDDTPFMHYGVRIVPVKREGTEEIAFLADVSLPNGNILQRGCCENLQCWKGREEMISMLSSAMTARLIEGLYKEIQHKISKIIFEEIKK